MRSSAPPFVPSVLSSLEFWASFIACSLTLASSDSLVKMYHICPPFPPQLHQLGEHPCSTLALELCIYEDMFKASFPDENKRHMGWYFFPCQSGSGKKMVTGQPSSIHKWNEKFFFISFSDNRYNLLLVNHWRMVKMTFHYSKPSLTFVEIEALSRLDGGGTSGCL
ncbi:hypothetical protein NE237_022491 [Protea cynaroides]|uniref:Uncharacterized protein n=1 Tax=Protea cynaroides TaxID=273540 RepID=A0A9Q0K4I6_9MAGN|nr:hypothetical protein NE237_022491 [Protea cynaroides]